jgi:hypothetical protein
MKRTSSLLLAAILVAASMHPARATTVIPPSFDQLVTQAELIFQGSVTDVRSQWVGEGAQRHIVTYVTFKVEDSLKGNSGPSYTVRMFGGTVGEDAMGISDAPTFKVGDRDILFVENNGTQAIPLVGIMYGRFHVQTDQAGEDVVTRNEGEPVKNVARLGREMEEAAPSSEAFQPNMTANAFKTAVKTRLQVAQ